MKPLEYLKKYRAIYNARDTRRRFIPLEKLAADPAKYGYSKILGELPAGYKSNAKQNDYLYSKAKVTAAICANRGGKSEVLTVRAIRTLEQQKIDKGGRYWILTESFDLQKAGIQQKIKDFFKHERIDKNSIVNVKKDCYKSFTYVNKWGVRIPVDFMTYEQGSAKLQAAKLYGASFDEEPPEDVYDEVYTRTLDLRGTIDMAFTPLKGFTWSYKRIFCAKSKKIKVFNWGMRDNPFIPRDEIDEMERTLSPKKAKMRLDGIYQGSEGMVYENFSRDKHIKPNLYDEILPVSVCIDWGVTCAAIGFFQEKKFVERGKTRVENYLIDAMEIEGAGYGKVMNTILQKGYYIPSNEWFCDPAGRQRNQTSRSGVSLLQNIEKDYGIKFNYIKRLGIEESIELVDSWLLNAKNETRFYIQEGIQLNSNGDTPAMRIEGYVRDDTTGQPIKDGINDHFADMWRYLVANKSHSENRGGWQQH